MTLAAIADRMGWYGDHGRPDSQRVSRALGIAATKVHGKHYLRCSVGHDLAVRLLRAMGVDPVDAGL